MPMDGAPVLEPTVLAINRGWGDVQQNFLAQFKNLADALKPDVLLVAK